MDCNFGMVLFIHQIVHFNYIPFVLCNYTPINYLEGNKTDRASITVGYRAQVADLHWEKSKV